MTNETQPVTAEWVGLIRAEVLGQFQHVGNRDNCFALLRYIDQQTQELEAIKRTRPLPNLPVRMAVQVALGRFNPTRLEELFGRVQAGVQLERHRQSLKRMEHMLAYTRLPIARDPNPIRHAVNLA